jgi:NRPS condensation-like uncharacterized protein
MPAIVTHQPLRPLGAIEEFLWLFDHSSPKHFCSIAEIQGSATMDAWRTALDALQKRHPMLSVCIDSTYNRVPHFRRVEDQPIPLRICQDDAIWEREAEFEIRTLFDPAKAPLFRVSLIPGTEKTVLLLVAHHSIADGISVTFLLRDLLAALSGGSLSQQAFPPSIDEFAGVPVRTSSEPGVRFSYDLARKCVESPVHVTSKALSSELTGSLQQRSRQENTTVHGVICAAAAIAARELHPPWAENPLRIFSPVNIREIYGLEDQSIAAFTKAQTVIEWNPSANLWEIARFVYSNLAPFKAKQANDAVLRAISSAMATNMNVEQGAEFNRQAFSEEIMVSNLGRIPFEPDFGKLAIKSLWAPVLLRGHQPEQSIGVATIGGVLHFVHTSFHPIPTLLERIEEKLTHACDPKENNFSSQENSSAGLAAFKE